VTDRDVLNHALAALKVIPPFKLRGLARWLDRMHPELGSEVQDDLREMARRSELAIRLAVESELIFKRTMNHDAQIDQGSKVQTHTQPDSRPLKDVFCLHCSAPVCAACGFCQGCKNYICDKCSDKYKHWFTPDGKNHGGLGLEQKKEKNEEVADAP
jgi:hypothetical protein